MKRLLCSLPLVAMLALASCEAPSDSSTSVRRTDPSSNGHGGGGTTANAHPAWTYMTQTYLTSGHGASRTSGIHYSITVSDSDGTDAGPVYVCSGSTSEQARFPTWSPSGSSVSFVDGVAPTVNGWYNLGFGAYSIKAVDVSVSGGVAVGTNDRTVCSFAASDSVRIVEQQWCPSSSVNKIAFVGLSPTDGGIYTVSGNGGTPIKIYGSLASHGVINCGPYMGNSLGWSNDGSKIAFAEADTVSGSLSYTIKIIDASDGSLITTLDAGTDHILGGVQWSNPGTNNQNTLSYYRSTNGGSTWYLCTIGTTSGSTPTTVASPGINAFWSPDNSELIYQDWSTSPYTLKKVDVASGSTTALSISTGSIANYGDWKQP